MRPGHRVDNEGVRNWPVSRYRFLFDGLGGGASEVRPFWQYPPCRKGCALGGMAVLLNLPFGEFIRVTGEIQNILLAAHKVNP